MNEYGSSTEDKMEKVMHEFKQGTLKSRSGDKVTDRDQAVAIGMSESRESEEKTPAKEED